MKNIFISGLVYTTRMNILEKKNWKKNNVTIQIYYQNYGYFLSITETYEESTYRKIAFI